MVVMRLLFVVIAEILLSAGAACAGDYEDGAAAYNRGDFVTAKRLWLPLADRGEARAQTCSALLYFLGQGVKANLAAALDWCSKAAAQGLPAAQYELPWDPQVRNRGHQMVRQGGGSGLRRRPGRTRCDLRVWPWDAKGLRYHFAASGRFLATHHTF